MKPFRLLALGVALLAGVAGVSSCTSKATAAAPTPQNDTERAAFEVMEKIGWGTNAATRELDEDLWHIINQANLGLIWNRPGLSLRDRELIVMSVLVAEGSDGVSHLMQHADAVGITDAEIRELILQTIPYSGQPNAIKALLTLKRVQEERQK